jgi:hypothetical protein
VKKVKSTTQWYKKIIIKDAKMPGTSKRRTKQQQKTNKHAISLKTKKKYYRFNNKNRNNEENK